MAFDSLTQEALDQLLQHTSPHSFKFNVKRALELAKLPINTEPTTDPDKLGETLEDLLISLKVSLQDELQGVSLMIDDARKMGETSGEEASDMLVILTTILAGVMFHRRSLAMNLGVPLEEVTEALIGSAIQQSLVPDFDVDLMSVTSTILYGIK